MSDSNSDEEIFYLSFMQAPDLSHLVKYLKIAVTNLQKNVAEIDKKISALEKLLG